MRHINVRTEAASVRVSQTVTSAASLFETSRKALFLIWARIGLHPATAFGFLSLAFGSLVAIVIPPLRGPDEISHFLRIYSYARGELLPVAEVTRVRVAALTGLTVLGYVVVVYLIFFLTYTPLDVNHVRGVQGRYFIIVLPVAAVFVAAVINRELPNGMPSAIAIAGSLLSGTATFEALFQAHW